MVLSISIKLYRNCGLMTWTRVHNGSKILYLRIKLAKTNHNEPLKHDGFNEIRIGQGRVFTVQVKQFSPYYFFFSTTTSMVHFNLWLIITEKLFICHYWGWYNMTCLSGRFIFSKLSLVRVLQRQNFSRKFILSFHSKMAWEKNMLNFANGCFSMT